MNAEHPEIKGWGVDARPEQRPGVPREGEPRPVEGAYWREPERQQSDVPHMVRVGLDRITPVYGTAQPVRGVSGAMRRMAYKIPEHKATHWMTLLLADRVDFMEHALEKRTPGGAFLLPLGAAAIGTFALSRLFGGGSSKKRVARERKAHARHQRELARENRGSFGVARDPVGTQF